MSATLIFRAATPDDEQRIADWAQGFDLGQFEISVCEAGGDLVGFVAANAGAGGRARTAEITAIHVRPAHCRQGIGTTLFRAMLDRLRGQGMRNFRLYVTKGSEAEAFFRALGGMDVEERTRVIDGAAVCQVEYVW